MTKEEKQLLPMIPHNALNNAIRWDIESSSIKQDLYHFSYDGKFVYIHFDKRESRRYSI